MKSSWLKGHSDKEARTNKVLSYRTALNELKEILERDYKRKESVRDYGAPGWEYRQVAVNERNQAIDDIIELITIKEK